MQTWAYHSTCPEGQIFETPGDVPEGWVDSPAKLVEEAPKRRGRPPKVKHGDSS